MHRLDVSASRVRCVGRCVEYECTHQRARATGRDRPRIVCAFLIQPYIERDRDQSIWGNGKRIGARISGMAQCARARCACKDRSHEALLLLPLLLCTRVIPGRIGSSTCIVDILRDTRATRASRVIYSKVHDAASFCCCCCCVGTRGFLRLTTMLCAM